jgi:hypothetical protein
MFSSNLAGKDKNHDVQDMDMFPAQSNGTEKQDRLKIIWKNEA